MVFYEKKVFCSRCGKKITIWAVQGMSAEGGEAISICENRWRERLEKGKELIYGEDRSYKND